MEGSCHFSEIHFLTQICYPSKYMNLQGKTESRSWSQTCPSQRRIALEAARIASLLAVEEADHLGGQPLV